MSTSTTIMTMTTMRSMGTITIMIMKRSASTIITTTIMTTMKSMSTIIMIMRSAAAMTMSTTTITTPTRCSPPGAERPPRCSPGRILGEYGRILRAKGIVNGGAGWIEFDYVPEEHEIRDGRPDYTGRLCVIGSELSEDKLARLFGL